MPGAAHKSATTSPGCAANSAGGTHETSSCRASAPTSWKAASSSLAASTKNVPATGAGRMVSAAVHSAAQGDELLTRTAIGRRFANSAAASSLMAWCL